MTDTMRLGELADRPAVLKRLRGVIDDLDEVRQIVDFSEDMPRTLKAWKSRADRIAGIADEAANTLELILDGAENEGVFER